MNKSGAVGGRGRWWAVKWAMVLLGCGLLGWRMVVVGISQQLVRNGGREAIEVAVGWPAENPDALLARALDLSVSDPREAERLLRQAIWLAPTNGRLFARLGQLLERRGETERAGHAMQIAEKLASRNSAVQAELAEFWGHRNQPEPYLRHLVTLADLNASYWKQVHPALLAVVDNPAYGVLVRRVLSETLADGVPYWWKPFFYFAGRNASRLDTVRLLYSIRASSSTPPSDPERRAFLLALERGKRWLEAYFVWLNALDGEHLAGVGNLFNGSFSFPLMNEGFGWRFVASDGVDAAVAAVDGASGGKALRVRFSGRHGQVVHLGQYLILPPGEYHFSGRVRSVAIEGASVPFWTFSCVAPESSVLAKSVAFSGTAAWQPFSLSFEVPEDKCEVQQLRLVQPTDTNGGKTLTGRLWFDDLVIENLD